MNNKTRCFQTATLAAIQAVALMLPWPSVNVAEANTGNSLSGQGYGRGRNFDGFRLSGTYQIDEARSDNVWKAARRATRGLSPEQQERLRQMLSRRLDAPETLAIDGRGRNITVASTRGPSVTFDADGRARVEQTPRGRTIRTTATVSGGHLVVSSVGERGSDFTVTFDSLDGGRRLRVTRRLDIESLSQPVTVTSFYNRTDTVARLDLYRETEPVQGRPVERRRGPFEVPEGTQLTASLDNPLNTAEAREGDRFTMTVRSPSRFEGDVIEGYVVRSNAPGRASGRAELTLNFERIRMRNGSTRDFDGYIENVIPSNGEDVRVDNEGRLSERDSQTGRTVQRTGIGAALGAVIGALAGGGKGAAVGAAIGAGAGAGSVFIQGRDQLELTPGTQFTIRATGVYREESRR